jgi:glycosyltransferase involved in cell wall biosynthesis
MTKAIFVTSDLNIGGLQRVTTLVGNSLSKKNEISFFLLKKGLVYSTDLKVIYSEKNIFETLLNLAEKIKNRFFKIVTKTEELNSFYYRQLLKEIKNQQVNTVVLTGYSLLFAERLKKEIPSLKVILWMHNNYEVYFQNYFQNFSELLKKCIEKADKIVTLTEIDKLGFGRYSDKVIKIINPLTIDNQGYFSNLDIQTISMTCRYDIQHKGLDYLVEIAKKLPKNWKISIAGTGTDEEIDLFRALIEHANVKEKIFLRGALQGEELIQHYQESSIYMMTSRWEGLPLVLAEAMSFGLPIISFKNSGSKEVLEDGKYGIIIEQGSIDKFVEKLIQLISVKGYRREYSKKSLVRVKDFELTRIIECWNEII